MNTKVLMLMLAGPGFVGSGNPVPSPNQRSRNPADDEEGPVALADLPILVEAETEDDHECA